MRLGDADGIDSAAAVGRVAAHRLKPVLLIGVAEDGQGMPCLGSDCEVEFCLTNSR